MDKIVIGLGNPGTQYKYTRHNIGFRIVDIVAQHFHLNFRSSSFQAEVADGTIHETKFLLVKPTTYMNLSGNAVQTILHWYKLDTLALLVISDDFNLPLGKIRIRQAGSSGGHHGLDSIIQCLQTVDFLRLRIGIGPNFCPETTQFVLGKFNEEEEAILAPAILSAKDAVIAWIENQPVTKILNCYNSSSSKTLE